MFVLRVFLSWCVLVQFVDAGASAYYRIEDIIDELDPGAILEIGSDRGEGSTQFFSDIANKTGREFFSVDFSDDGFRNAQSVCGSCANQAMGEDWLDRFAQGTGAAKQIALAYLDNYDWTYPWTTAMAYKLQQHIDYGQQGLRLSNEKSQAVHLAQAERVERLCSERCFILFDDTWPSASYRKHSGKGGAALRFLLSRGFEIVEQSDPEQPSHMGWVLVRRLPAPQRFAPDAPSPASPADPPTGPVRVHIISPRDGAELQASSSEGGAVLSVSLAVAGVVEGEHTLVVHSNGVEVLRLSNWPNTRPCAAAAAEVDATAAEGSTAEGLSAVCATADPPAAASPSAQGSAETAGAEAATELWYSRVEVLLRGVEDGPRRVLLQVVDSDHTVVAETAVAVRVAAG